jgi:hypothetical protein
MELRDLGLVRLQIDQADEQIIFLPSNECNITALQKEYLRLMGDPSALPRLRVFHNGTDVTKTTNYKIPSHSIIRLTVPQNFILLTFAIKDTDRIFHYYFSPHSSYRHVTQFLANFCVFCEHKIIILSVSNFKGDTKVKGRVGGKTPYTLKKPLNRR